MALGKLKNLAGQVPARSSSQALGPAVDQAPQPRQFAEQDQGLVLRQPADRLCPQPPRRDSWSSPAGQHDLAQAVVGGHRRHQPTPRLVLPLAIPGQQRLDVVDEEQHSPASHRLGQLSQPPLEPRRVIDRLFQAQSGQQGLEDAREPPQRAALVGPVRHLEPGHPVERVLVGVGEFERARGLAHSGHAGQQDSGPAGPRCERGAGPCHDRGPADETLRLRREHARRPAAARTGPAASRRRQRQVGCRRAEQHRGDHRQRRLRQLGWGRGDLPERPAESPRQRRAFAGHQLIHVLRERSGELIADRIPHGQDGAAKPAHDLGGHSAHGGSAGWSVLLLAPPGPVVRGGRPAVGFVIDAQPEPAAGTARRGRPACRQRHQAEPLPRRSEQAGQIGRVDRVRRAVLAFQQQVARRAVTRNMHDVPAALFGENGAQLLPGDAVLQHAGLDGPARVSYLLADIQQVLPFPALVQGAFSGGEAEQAEHAKTVGRRCAARARGVGCLVRRLHDQGHVLGRQRPSSGLRELQRAEHQVFCGARHDHAYGGRRGRGQGPGDGAKHLRPDPVADLPGYPGLVLGSRPRIRSPAQVMTQR
jgi:hypothetical protein